VTPIPKPRKRTGGAGQSAFVSDEGRGLSTPNQGYDHAPILNRRRRRLPDPRDWRARGWTNVIGRRLLTVGLFGNNIAADVFTDMAGTRRVAQACACVRGRHRQRRVSQTRRHPIRLRSYIADWAF
jgi:hypothetical protein